MCYLSYAGCNNNIRHQENDLSKQLVKQACGSLDRPSSVYMCLSAWDKDAHKPFCYLEKVDTWRQTLGSSVSRNSFWKDEYCSQMWLNNIYFKMHTKKKIKRRGKREAGKEEFIVFSLLISLFSWEKHYRIVCFFFFFWSMWKVFFLLYRKQGRLFTLLQFFLINWKFFFKILPMNSTRLSFIDHVNQVTPGLFQLRGVYAPS